MNPLGVGFIGLGETVNLNHLPTIAKSDLVRAVAGTDITAARRDKFASEIDGPIYADLDPLLNNADVDIVVVATPHLFHKEHAVAALEAGKHVICEKPFGLNLSEARQIAAVAERTGRYASVFQNRRFDADSIAIFQAVESGAIGDLVSISRAHYRHKPHTDWAAQEYRPNWRLEAWGGHLIDWGPHLLNQLSYLAKSEPKSVYCQLRGVKWTTESDDFFTLIVEYQNGVIGKAEVCVFAHAGQNEWHVIGTEATLVCKSFNEPVFIYRHGQEPIPVPVGEHQWVRIYDSLASHLAGTGDPEVPVAEALATMELIEAARKSATSGQSVNLPL